MTKQELQKELQEKIKEGVKPSDLKKLKRSKSLSDLPSEIPKAPPLPNPELTKSKSSESFSDPRYPFTTLISQSEEIDSLKKESQAKSDTIALLRKKIEQLEKQLKESPPSPLLQEQLRQKQKELEELRAKLQEKSAQLIETTQELDNSLIARAENSKLFSKVYEQLKDTRLELIQVEDDATDDIISQDQEISQLRSENRQLKQTNHQLANDLDLAWRLAELRNKSSFDNERQTRKVPLPSSQSNYSSNLAPDYLRFALYSLLFTKLNLNNLNLLSNSKKMTHQAYFWIGLMTSWTLTFLLNNLPALLITAYFITKI